MLKRQRAEIINNARKAHDYRFTPTGKPDAEPIGTASSLMRSWPF